MSNGEVEPPPGFQIICKFPVSSAFKEVFQAVKSTPLGAVPVVLKRYQPLSTQTMQTLMERFNFKTESDIIAKDSVMYWAGPLRHPNLVPCDIAQNQRGDVFLVEPLLEVTFDKQPAASHWVAIDWLEGLAKGLGFLHSCGYVHGDLKPDNMGLLKGVPVLLDFGISTQLRESAAGKTDPGSIRTRPPELFGHDVRPTIASDIWSLGASVYFLLTKGDFPFMSRRELDGIPAAGSPQRQEFERRVSERAQAALQDEGRFLADIGVALVREGVEDLFGHISLILMCLRIDPRERPSASTLVLWKRQFENITP